MTTGYEAVSPDCDLVCLGEMGIGNTTAAAAIAAALFGGGGARWAGRGTGVDEDGLARKRDVIDRGARAPRRRCCTIRSRSPRPSAAANSPPSSARRLAARRQRIPVLLDGFVCTAAVAPLAKLRADTLAHAQAGHVSAEAGHRTLLDELGLVPLLDLNMRLGEASGAAVALLHPARGAGVPHRHGDVRRGRRLGQTGGQRRAEGGELIRRNGVKERAADAAAAAAGCAERTAFAVA